MGFAEVRFSALSGQKCLLAAWSGSVDAFEIREASGIVDEVGETDLHLGCLYTNGAHEEAHAGFLVGEHMLDTGANDGFTGIGSPGPGRHIAVRRLLVMDLRHEAMALHEALICP